MRILNVLKRSIFLLALLPTLTLFANDSNLIARGGGVRAPDRMNEARGPEGELHGPDANRVDPRLNNPYDRGAVQGYERGVNQGEANGAGGGALYVVPPPVDPQYPGQ